MHWALQIPMLCLPSCSLRRSWVPWVFEEENIPLYPPGYPDCIPLSPSYPHIGGFHESGYPQMDGSEWKILYKWMIWGYLYLCTPPILVLIFNADLGGSNSPWQRSGRSCPDRGCERVGWTMSLVAMDLSSVQPGGCWLGDCSGEDHSPWAGNPFSHKPRISRGWDGWKRSIRSWAKKHIPDHLNQPHDRLKNAGWFFGRLPGSCHKQLLNWSRKYAQGFEPLVSLQRPRQVISHCSCGWPWLEPLAWWSPCRLCWSYAAWQGLPFGVSCHSSFFFGVHTKYIRDPWLWGSWRLSHTCFNASKERQDVLKRSWNDQRTDDDAYVASMNPLCPTGKSWWKLVWHLMFYAILMGGILIINVGILGGDFTCFQQLQP